MPKVVVNNTKGLHQVTGGGLALYGAVESVAAVAAAANAPIAKTTSLALVTSGNNAHQCLLPAIGDVEVGHTVVIASIGTHDVVIHTPSSETINGAATITTGENTTVMCIKATASTWVALIA